MNFKEKMMAEERTNRLYQTPGNPGKVRPKNAIFYSTANTTLHELSKALGGLMLHKWGDVKFTKDVKEKLVELANIVDQAHQGLPKEGKAYITEAVPNSEMRRVDLVRLEDDYRFEFEVSNQKNKKDPERAERTVKILVP